MNKIKIGRLGENIAKSYLLGNGYKILEKNHRDGFDEIDIIGIDKEGALIFFEVKAIFNRTGFLCGFMPEDHLTMPKLKKIARASRKFLAKHQTLINEDIGWRIDLIAIIIKPELKYDLHHYKNI